MVIKSVVQCSSVIKMDDSMLIDAVRSRGEIYNKGHAGFKNPAIKDSAWKCVAEAVNASVADCISRWHTLRERYTKEKRLQEGEERSGAGASRRPTWVHWNSLTFLNAHIRQRKSIINLPPLSCASAVQPPLSSPSLSTSRSTSSVDEEVSRLLSPGYLENRDCVELITDSQELETPENSQFTVIAQGSPIPGFNVAEVGSTKSIAGSLPYLGPTGRCKKPKLDETAEMFKQTLANLNEKIAAPAPAPTPQHVELTDPDTLIGQSVTVCLKSLQDHRLRLCFRRKFRDIVQQCEETMIEDQ